MKNGFVIAAQVEGGPLFAFDGLAQAVHGHATGEIGRKLRGTLLGANNFQPGLAFGLKGPLGEKLQRLVVGNGCAVHFVVENGIGHCAEIELKLCQPQGQVSVTITLVEHGLFRINPPSPRYTLPIGARCE